MEQSPAASLPAIAPEPWVDIHAVADHINFSYSKTRKMVISGEIPGRPIRSGRRTYWRFRLSAVDAALETGLADAIPDPKRK